MSIEQSFTYFFLFLLSVFLVSAQAGTEPHDIVLDVDNDTTFDSGEVIDVFFDVNFSGPISLTTSLYGKLGSSQESELTLTDLFALENIPFVQEGAVYDAVDPVDTLFLAFPGAGKQTISMKILGDADHVASLEMKIVGFANEQGNYVTFPSIDVDGDGTVEWQYFGEHTGYLADYTLPSGLDEQHPGPFIHVTGEEKYYCEIIDIPYGRDFTIATKVQDNGTTTADLHATIFSYTSTGSGSLTAFGGDTFDCLFDTVDGSTGFSYHTCEMHIDYSIQGEHLVCVYNINANAPSETYAFLQVDDSYDSAYFCTPEPTQGEFHCSNQGQQGDYFIKVKGGEYSQTLEGVTSFTEWLVTSPEYFFINLNDNIDQCLPVSGGCMITLEIESTSAGLMSLQDLTLVYHGGGSTGPRYSTDKFYKIEATSGVITDIDGVELVDGETLTFDTSRLFLVAPNVTEDSNYTLEVAFNPGPSDSERVIIMPALLVAGEEDLDFLFLKLSTYIDILETEKTNYAHVLSALDLTSDVSSAVTTLNQHYSQAVTLNQSNKTEDEILAEVFNISLDVDDLIEDLPSSIVVHNEATDVIIAEPIDILDTMIIEGEKNEANRMKVYHAQQSYSVTGEAVNFEVEYFDGTEEKSTAITKKLSGSGSNFVVFEVIPNSIVPDVNDILFESGFTKVQSSPEAIFKKDFSSLRSASFSYTVKSNVVSGLSSLKTIIVPTTLPSGGVSDILPVCGDGICSVLDVDGALVPLEDAVTCPADCSKKINWTALIIVLIIGALIIAAVIVYVKFAGKSSGVHLRVKGKKTKTIFASTQDEQNLRTYIKKAVKNKVTRPKITATLLKRGWKKEQIDQVFKTLGGNKKPSSGFNY